MMDDHFSTTPHPKQLSLARRSAPATLAAHPADPLIAAGTGAPLITTIKRSTSEGFDFHRAVIVVRHSGYSMGIHSNQHPRPGIRGECCGWTPAAARGNEHFLQSVFFEQIVEQYGAGGVVAFTFTLRDTPTPEIWIKYVRNMRLWFQRHGAVLGHHVTEYQFRGAPHLHGVIIGDPRAFGPDFCLAAVRHWCKQSGGLPHCQNLKHVSGLRGWLEYLAKHSARSIYNYQRRQATADPLWRDHTPRMWGKWGAWPLVEPTRVYMLSETQFQIRRRLWRLRSGEYKNRYGASGWDLDNLKTACRGLAGEIKSTRQEIPDLGAYLRTGSIAPLPAPDPAAAFRRLARLAAPRPRRVSHVRQRALPNAAATPPRAPPEPIGSIEERIRSRDRYRSRISGGAVV